jgi:hypothetical protein
MGFSLSKLFGKASKVINTAAPLISTATGFPLPGAVAAAQQFLSPFGQSTPAGAPMPAQPQQLVVPGPAPRPAAGLSPGVLVVGGVLLLAAVVIATRRRR